MNPSHSTSLCWNIMKELEYCEIITGRHPFFFLQQKSPHTFSLPATCYWCLLLLFSTLIYWNRKWAIITLVDYLLFKLKLTWILWLLTWTFWGMWGWGGGYPLFLFFNCFSEKRWVFSSVIWDSRDANFLEQPFQIKVHWYKQEGGQPSVLKINMWSKGITKHVRGFFPLLFFFFSSLP